MTAGPPEGTEPASDPAPSPGDADDPETNPELLATAVRALAFALTERDVAAAVVEPARAALGAGSCWLAVVPTDATDATAVDVAGAAPPALAEAYRRLRADRPGPVADVVLAGRTVLVDSADGELPWPPGTLSALLVPLPGRGAAAGAVGVLGFTFDRVGGADERLAAAFARPAGDALERSRLFAVEQVARRRAERSLAIARALAAADGEQAAAAALAAQVRAELGADVVAVTRLDDTGRRLSTVAADGTGPLAGSADVELDRSPLAADALSGGGTIALGSVAELADRYPSLAADPRLAGAGAVAVVPLPLAERPAGALFVAWSVERRLATPELLLLDALAPQCADALARARAIDVAGLRARRLQTLTAALAGAVTPVQVTAVALGPAREALDADGAALVSPEPADVDPATPAGAAVRSGEPVYVGSELELRRRYPAATNGSGERAWMALPLRAGDGTLGALTFTFPHERDFDATERAFAENVAAQCALALERARLYESATTDRERLYAVLARLPAGVIIGEAPSGRLVLGNEEMERIWRHPFRPAGDVGGYDVYQAFHADGQPFTGDDWPLARSIRYGEVISNAEVDIRRGDGTRGTIMVNSAPIRDADGAIVAAVVTMLDITERVEARRRAEELYEAEQHARAAAERARRRVERLQRVTAALSEAVTVRQVADVVVRAGRSMVDADRCWLGGLDETGGAVVALASTRPSAEGRDLPATIDAAGSHPIAVAVRTGRPLWLESAAEVAARFPDTAPPQPLALGAFCAVPLTARGRPVGVLALAFDGSRRLGPNERALIDALAGQCGQALERAQLHQREHDVALALQHSMLPGALPELSDVDVAVRYQPAESSLAVGGDWYDVVALPEGRVALAVGDVVGRGLAAATVMGQLRSALSALAVSADGPADVLDRLELFARHVANAGLATVVFGILDLRTGRFRYACAGHPPPLLVGADGATRLLEGGRSAMLSVLPVPARRREAEVQLEAGDALLLYTDGLVERRGESLDAGLARLGEQAAKLAGSTAADLCARLLDAMPVDPGHPDDVAMLSLRYHPPLRRRLRAYPQNLRGLRREIRGWLRGVGADEAEVADVVLAVGEACANAVEHAYPSPDGPGDLVVELHLGAGREVRVTVRDEGRWRADPAPGDRGRGLPLMRALMAGVDVTPGPAGTAVRMRRRLGEPL